MTGIASAIINCIYVFCEGSSSFVQSFRPQGQATREYSRITLPLVFELWMACVFVDRVHYLCLPGCENMPVICKGFCFFLHCLNCLLLKIYWKFAVMSALWLCAYDWKACWLCSMYTAHCSVHCSSRDIFAPTKMSQWEREEAAQGTSFSAACFIGSHCTSFSTEGILLLIKPNLRIGTCLPAVSSLCW